MTTPSISIPEFGSIQNPFEKKAATDLFLDKQHNPVAHDYATQPHAISNPFKASRDEKNVESSGFPHTNHTFRPTDDSARGMHTDPLSLRVFHKCKDIRRKANEFAQLRSRQNEARMRLQARVDDIEKRNAAISHEIEQSQAQRAEMRSLSESLAHITDRISSRTLETRKIQDQSTAENKASGERRQEMRTALENARRTVDGLKRQSVRNESRLASLRREFEATQSAFGSSRVSADFDRAVEQLAEKRSANDRLEADGARGRQDLADRRAALATARKASAASMEALRKLKACNERLRLIHGNAVDRLALAATGRAAESAHHHNDRQLAAVFHESIEKIASAVARARSSLDANEEAVGDFNRRAQRVLNGINTEADERSPADGRHTWKDVCARFAQNFRSFSSLDHNLIAENASLKRRQPDNSVNQAAFDATAGLDLWVESDKDNQLGDGMNEASCFHGESIWVFQEAKSVVVENGQGPEDSVCHGESIWVFQEPQSEVVENGRCHEPQQAAEKTIGSYPIPDYPYDPRTPPRGDLLHGSSSAGRFAWESVLPPSPHDRPSAALSMDFLRDPEGVK